MKKQSTSEMLRKCGDVMDFLPEKSPMELFEEKFVAHKKGGSDCYEGLPTEFVVHASDNIKKHVEPPICNEDLSKNGKWLIRFDANHQPCLYRTFSPPTAGAMQGLEQVACGIEDLLAIYLELDDFIYLRGE